MNESVFYSDMPLASALLLTYNQEIFVAEALQSLLDQDYVNLEIIISDDQSTDRTMEVVRSTLENYTGSKKIIVNKNELNMGVVGNFFKAFNISSGEVIFTAGGDDISILNRCSTCIQNWNLHSRGPDLVATDAYDMSVGGVVVGEKHTDSLEAWNLNKWSLKRPFIFGASHMMTRRLMKLRELDCALKVEDQCLLFRALLMGGAVRVAIPLVKHRRGGLSQKCEMWSYESKKIALIESANQNLLEIKEMTLDGYLCKKEVNIYFSYEVALCRFIIDMLHSKSLAHSIVLLFKKSEVNWGKRLKYFAFRFFSAVYRFIFFLKRS